MSLRTTLSVSVALASLTGCFLPDDYNPCGGPCPDAEIVVDGGTAFSPDVGPALASVLGTVVHADARPPALAGGTLLALPDGRAILGDPETDTLAVLDATVPAQIGEVALASGDEPGRMVADATGRVHVVLRGAGALATIDVSDPRTPRLTERRAVCPIPRGLAYDPVGDVLFVACMGGELVTLPPVGPSLRTVRLADDLRDVVVDGTELWLTRFRSAEVLVVDAPTGTLLRTLALPSVTEGGHAFAPAVAWRMLAAPGGGVMVLHQVERADAVLRQLSGFGTAACTDAVVRARITRSRGAVWGASAILPCAVLAVDAAISPDASAISFALAGAAPLDACHPITTLSLRSGGTFGSVASAGCAPVAGRVVAVAYASDGALLAQTRAPLGLVVSRAGVSRDLQLPGSLVLDTGFDVFHSSTTDHVACASCHPEGGDDGRVWLFDERTAHRTMSLRGGVLATAPFAWHGELPTFARLIEDVFTRQMMGGVLSPEALAATAGWLDAEPPLPPRASLDAAAAARGQALFEGVAFGCSACHAGERLSNQATLDLGTGEAFQVPSLRGVAYRLPLFHDGCATSLRGALGGCGGSVHAAAATASAAQLDELIAYLARL